MLVLRNRINVWHVRVQADTRPGCSEQIQLAASEHNLNKDSTPPHHKCSCHQPDVAATLQRHLMLPPLLPTAVTDCCSASVAPWQLVSAVVCGGSARTELTHIDDYPTSSTSAPLSPKNPLRALLIPGRQAKVGRQIKMAQQQRQNISTNCQTSGKGVIGYA